MAKAPIPGNKAAAPNRVSTVAAPNPANTAKAPNRASMAKAPIPKMAERSPASQYTLDETYDVVRAGARLILSYDSGSNAFRGTVQNVTNSTLRRVRVEVHLSNGIELGPTTPIDLPPGETVDVTLKASEQSFETWSAHPEVG